MRRALAAALVTGLLATGGGVGLAGTPEVPPPTPVPPAGSPSPYPSVLETPEPSPDKPPTLGARGAALVDLDSGAVLFEKRSTKRRPIASTTKIMTAMLVLEFTTPFEKATASEKAVAAEGAELGLEPGERRPVGELLYALMLQSANDAAITLAEHVAGTVKKFVREMNVRARALGLTNTRFASPNGLDDAGYSTAKDLAAITVEAYRNPAFADVVDTRRKRIPAPNGPDRRIQNRNALLWLYPDAIGVKTGFTAAAGFCLVAAAERDGLRLVAVVLGAKQEAFSDAAALLDHGFAAYERRVAVTAGDPLDAVQVEGSDVSVTAGETVAVAIGRGDPDPVLTIEPRAGLRLPITEGDVLGEIVIEYTEPGNSEPGEVRVPLVAQQTVRPPPRAATAPEDESGWWEPILDALRAAFTPLLDDPAI